MRPEADAVTSVAMPWNHLLLRTLPRLKTLRTLPLASSANDEPARQNSVIVTLKKSKLGLLFEQVYFADPELEREFEEAYIANNIKKSLLRLSTFLIMAIMIVFLRLLDAFSEFERLGATQASIYLTIWIQLAFLITSLLLIIMLHFIKSTRVHMQSILVTTVLLSVSAVLITTQVGSNQLLKKWPTNAVLVILGTVSISVRLRYIQCLTVTCVTNSLYILGLFINPVYSTETSTQWTEFFQTIGILLCMSYIFVHSSFANESLRRTEYLHIRQMRAENRDLKAKLDQAAAAAAKSAQTINLDSPLEKILTRLNTVLTSCGTDGLSGRHIAANITEVIQLLGSNSESLLRPDFAVREGENADRTMMKFMSLDINRDSMKTLHGKRDPSILILPATSSIDKKTSFHASRKTVGTGLTQIIGTAKRDEYVTELAQDLPTWNIDYLDYNKRTSGNAIMYLARAIFEEHNLIEELKISETIFDSFFGELQRRYLNVFYHNNAHGADVCHSFYHILLSSRRVTSLQPIELMAGVIACLGHDVKHPGLNNAFLMNTNAPEALIYNDRAVLENMHVAEIFKIASIPSMNIFHSLTRDQYKTVRGILIDMILATDLSRHFEIMAGLKIKLASTPASTLPAPNGGVPANTDLFAQDTALMLRIVIKLADIGHFAKVNPLHLKWNDLVLEEFYHQGDVELAKGLEVSAYMDRRDRHRLGQNQVSFMKYVVQPLFDTAGSVFEGFSAYSTELESNIKYWADYDASNSDTVAGGLAAQPPSDANNATTSPPPANNV